MKSKLLRTLTALTLAFGLQPSAFGQGTAFTYQGRLDYGGVPASGIYDLRFAVNDSLNGGNVRGLLTNSAVAVSNGLFTTTLDFGLGVFNGGPRWLELAVRSNGSAAAFTPLNPRQAITATPYAIQAANAGTAANASSVLGLAVNTNLSSVTLGTGNTASAAFATVSGGTANNASAAYATVSGGTDNTASGERATVGGGYFNMASGDRSVVAGGYGNEASGYTAFVGGGLGNRVSGNYATLGGGDNNIASGGGAFVGGGSMNNATNAFATVPGGENNLAGGQYSFAAGRRAKALHDGAFVWADSQNADFPSTAADQFLIRASGGVGINNNNPGGAALAVNGNVTVQGQFKGGYVGNVIDSGVVGGFIAGGGTGLGRNQVAGNYASVLGGVGNTASGEISTVMGSGAWASGPRSTAMGDYTHSSGYASTAMGSQTAATNNDSTAMGRLTLAGGSASTAMGYRARALHRGSFVWADQQEVDFDSTSTNQFAVRATGGFILDGKLGIGLSSPGYSLDVQSAQAVGRMTTTSSVNGAVLVLRNTTASPSYLGAINFEDAGGTPGQIGYLASGQMTFRVGGQERMTLQAGGLYVNGTFVSSSDRNVKEDFAAVNAQEVLAKVVALPLQSWSYTNRPGVKHVGPMAQDFHAAFGLGSDDKGISTVDADGVALAAIQGLNQKVEEREASLREKLEARSQKLEAENAELRNEILEIKRLLTKLTTKGN
jgi:hypothetical protein